ncbi:MAG: right-handed parallel beta-helix repeat-containing protein [bacterium]|nr:right-handed parallel beta-helix repeat-containing protein [bacterium]
MQRYIPLFLLIALVSSGAVNARTVRVNTDLQTAIDKAKSGDTLILSAAEFSAKPTSFVEPLCGNCLDPRTPVAATYGFIIKDKSITIVGSDRAGTRLITNAGYGLYIENSQETLIRNLTITGGVRDTSGNATDAGIVIRSSKVRIEQVDVRDNTHRLDSVVVGIGGIFSREASEVTISHCGIINNGWDGVALYRGANVTVTDCVIKDGRGAGIGVTWDGTCTAYRNDVSGFWKGIGAFGTSWVIARNNLVHDNLGWGMIATGESFMDMTNNVVYHNGNCGVAPWSTDARGRIVNNIIVDNGWRDEWVCPCVGVWFYGDWSKWVFTNNLVFNNKAGNYQAIWDQTDYNFNQSKDPMFVGNGDFHLKPESPAINSGDSTTYDPDGSISDLGIYGGSQRRK